MIRAFRHLSMKIIRTPAMGESITEGTLTAWHRSVGEKVLRDELVATIETDKIDVAVNSPESGTISQLFSKVGENVTVGGNLFEVQLGEDGAEMPAKTIHPILSSQHTATLNLLNEHKNDEPRGRIPLIKFLGPRNYRTLQPKPEILVESTASSEISPVISVIKNELQITKKDGVFVRHFLSIYDLPAKYQLRMSDEEMELVDVNLF